MFALHSKKFLKSFLAFTLLLCVLIPSLLFAQEKPLSQRPDVAAFIDLMVKNHDFKKPALEKLFNQVQLQDAVVQSIEHPAEAKTWGFYYNLFITDERIKKGTQFWLANQKTLTAVEKQYGVPANIIVAILGVETYYGERQGDYRVIDSLSTLAFNYSPRSPFFKKELEQYLLLTRENNIDPLSLKGSYAGAIGQPQFMPSSYRYYAIDYSNNNKIDLQNNTDDVIASIANYLKRNGWQPGNPITAPAKVSGKAYMKIDTADLKTRLDKKSLKQYGISSSAKIPSDTKVGLLVLNGNDNPEFHLGYDNFYTITRYNTSINYAMAVYLLSEAISEDMNSSQKK